jgi:hypothetical protein
MSDQTNDSLSKFELEAEALMAFEKARAMPRGMERAEALKKAGALQNTALLQCIGKPPADRTSGRYANSRAAADRIVRLLSNGNDPTTLYRF